MGAKRLAHKPGWKPCKPDDAVAEITHELEVFERCVIRRRIPTETISLRRWRIHSALHYLQELADQAQALKAQDAANDPLMPRSPVPLPYRAAVSVSALCVRSPEDAAALLEDIAARLRKGELVGERVIDALGEFRVTTLLAPPSARGVS